MRGKVSIDSRRREIVGKNERRRNVGKGLSKAIGAEGGMGVVDRSRVRGRCVVSRRGRGVMSRYKVSRVVLRTEGLEGKLAGMRKLLWRNGRRGRLKIYC